jgi:hypothetical protein
MEQVLGPLNYGGAALRAAWSGALVGTLIGWIFCLFNWIEPLISALALAAYGLIFGVIVGALFGLLVHALQRGRRDFTRSAAWCPGTTTSSPMSAWPIVRCHYSAAAAGGRSSWRRQWGSISEQPVR